LAYDETLYQRVRDLLSARTAFVETKLMGGLVFMVNGNMCCGVTDTSLLVRVGEVARNGALAKPHTRRMEFGGRSPKGFVFVDAKGCATDKALLAWVQQGLAFVATLPAKEKRKASTRRKA
jgi:TfoX/Sxy family transcriptional regulator of competence genes